MVEFRTTQDEHDMNFLKRLITAVVLLPALIAIIHVGGLLFSSSVILVGVYLSDEIFTMGLGKSHRLRQIFWPASLLLMLSAISDLNEHQAIFGLWLFLFFFALVLTFKPNVVLEEINRIGFVIVVWLYSFLGLLALYYLREGVEGDEIVGRSFIYLTLICTFSSDTFAYLIGRWLGRNPLFASVSQKKTWEGFFAGALASIFMPFIFSSALGLFEVELFVGLSLVDLLFVSIGIALLAPMGDLIESRVKRALNVKDSGTLLPGHGGLFDRIDALIVTLPFTLGYAFFLRAL